jgi:hypothetical protein
MRGVFRIRCFIGGAVSPVLGIAGVLVHPTTHILAYGPPWDEVEFDLAPSPGGDVASGLEIISGNDRVEVSAVPSADGLAIKTKGTAGTEINY